MHKYSGQHGIELSDTTIYQLYKSTTTIQNGHMQNLECLNFTIYGRVQSVGFRYFTLQIAKQLKLTGFVKNSENGTVTGTVSGEKLDLQAFFEEIRKGPPLSRVDKVSTEPGNNEGLENFSIR